jgi:hypothetical protein
MIDEGDCGVIGGMKIGRGNRSTRRKPASAPHCPPQIPLDQIRDPGGKPATNRLSYGAARINTYTKHPCLVWDSNPRSRLPSERKQYRPLGYRDRLLNKLVMGDIIREILEIFLSWVVEHAYKTSLGKRRTFSSLADASRYTEEGRSSEKIFHVNLFPREF